MNHVKPSIEELDQNINNISAELDNLEAQNKPVVPDLPSVPEDDTPQEPPVEEPKVEPEPEPEQPKDEPKNPEEDKSKPTDPKANVDYREKFVNSTREAQVLSYKNQEYSKTIDEAMEMPEATEEELKAKYPEWDLMNETEKILAKDNFNNSRRLLKIAEVNQKFREIDVWNEKVDTYLTDPRNLSTHPRLEGKEDEFKTFCNRPTRVGVDFDVLVNAFLFEVDSRPKPKPQGEMFPTGSGGPNEKTKPKSDKISIDQARILRETDYKKYTEYLRAGKIDQSELD